MSGLTAVDVVLRERGQVEALPVAVRAIRRYADASVFAKLQRAMRTDASAATLELILHEHNKDEQLDALESSSEYERALLPSTTAISPEKEVIVNHVLVYGAKRGSTEVVEWALRTYPDALVNGALRAAVNSGHASIAQRLHLMVRAFGFSFREDQLLDLAATRGHIDLLDWLFARRRDPRVRCSPTASENAAVAGHVHVLQWIRTHCRHQLSRQVLEQAAMHDQQCVMDWIYDEQIHAPVRDVMEAVAKRDKRDALMWLHRKYPRQRLSLYTLKHMSSTRQLDLAADLIASFPGAYARDGALAGVLCNDPGYVQVFTTARRHAKKELKLAMCAAARFGFLESLQWLHQFANDSRSSSRNGSVVVVPTKALWQAVRSAQVGVVEWILDQRPELRTRERLSEMLTTLSKQPLQHPLLEAAGNDRGGGNTKQLLQLLYQQLMQLQVQTQERGASQVNCSLDSVGHSSSEPHV